MEPDNSHGNTTMGCGQLLKDPEHMHALPLAAAGPSDDEGSPLHAKRKSSRKWKSAICSSNSFSPLEVETDSEADDDDFAAEEQCGTESSEVESDIQELTNAEV